MKMRPDPSRRHHPETHRKNSGIHTHTTGIKGTPSIVFSLKCGNITIARTERRKDICIVNIRSHHKTPAELVSSQPLAQGTRKNRGRREEESERKYAKQGKHTSREKKMKSNSSRSRSNTPPTSIKPPRHAPNPLLPAALQVALRVKLLAVHVALEVRRRAAVVAKQALHVQELARRLLRADFLAGRVSFALVRDGVGQGFGGGGVHVGAAGFGAPDRSVGWGGEGYGRGFGFGGGGCYGDCDEGGGDGYGDCGAVDVFGGGGGGEAGVGGCGCCDEGSDVDCGG